MHQRVGECVVFGFGLGQLADLPKDLGIGLFKAVLIVEKFPELKLLNLFYNLCNKRVVLSFIHSA